MGAICKQCKGDMQEVDACIDLPIRFEKDGALYAPSTEHFDELNGRCHDCNIVHGNIHHPGCDVERCPKCGLQFIGCDCWDLDWVESTAAYMTVAEVEEYHKRKEAQNVQPDSE
jgi:hypothetical protein